MEIDRMTTASPRGGRASLRWCLALTLLLGAPASTPWRAPALRAQLHEDPAHPRARAPLTILQINDVYSTVPVDGAGGLARVATLKREVMKTPGRTTLLMLGGDFLSSSVASTVFKGEQMIEALNAVGLDIATLGNHEFDFGVDLLVTRMRQARWQWVIANVVDRRTGRPVGDAAPYVMRTAGALKVAVIGLCLTDSMTAPGLRERLELIEPADAVARYLPAMKREGADVIVALTHLPISADRALAERFPEIDVIVGGHEHFPITDVRGGTLISKAGSEARYVARIDVDKRGAAPADRYYELIPITAAIPDDPAAAEVIGDWEARLGTELDLPLGSTRVPLDAETLRLRARETNLGNLVADAMRAEARTDAALVNSGGIRGDRTYPAGQLTRRLLLQIHPFNNVVCTIEVSGDLLRRALEHGVARLPLPAGGFPQVSGLTFRVVQSAPAGERVRDVHVGGEPLQARRTYTLALPDYLLEGGDGYEMFAGSRTIVDPESGCLIVTALERAVAGKEVAPAIDGRITIEP
ncbi:MAG: bifunctional UDP-sugar hydrolase/5'-nucleotidase [Vicinamibacterales bacterium]